MEGRDNLDPASGPPTLLGVSCGQVFKHGSISQLNVSACASNQIPPGFPFVQLCGPVGEQAGEKESDGTELHRCVLAGPKGMTDGPKAESCDVYLGTGA
jgi:hypothetical protein